MFRNTYFLEFYLMSSFVGFHVTVRPRVGTIDLRGDMETCWLWLNFECCVRGVVAIRIEYDLFLISSILYKFVPCWLYFLWRRIIMRCFRAFSFLGSSASPFRAISSSASSLRGVLFLLAFQEQASAMPLAAYVWARPSDSKGPDWQAEPEGQGDR